MKTWRQILLGWTCFGGLFGAPLLAQDWLEQAGERLQFQTANGTIRARLGVLLDLEVQGRDEPVADVLADDEPVLFAPRLTLNIDLQAGPRSYVFAQLRADRGFDAADRTVTLRLDEYAWRFAVLPRGALNLQVGKFATVVGNWVARHDARKNPFISAPLPYELLTGLWDLKPPPTTAKLLEWSHVQPLATGAGVLADKGFRLPLIWGPAYSHGVMVSGTWGRFNAAAELKVDALTARPAQWQHAALGGRRLALGARAGWRPNEMWDFGISYSEGEYLASRGGLLPSGAKRQHYQQRLWAQDIGFAWHRFQFWAELFAVKFTAPPLAELRSFSYYLEAKYKFSPSFSGAMRWSQQTYSSLPAGGGRSLPWSRDTWRLEIAPTWRIGAHSQLKLQLGVQHERPALDTLSSSWAAQYSLWF